MHPGVLESVAETFVKHGDLLSQLYTQTPAMHMAAIHKYAPRLPKPKQNAEIVVERRMHNMIFDHQKGGRHDQYNMFVGQAMHKYFPWQLGATTLRSLATSSTAFSFRQVPTYFDDQQSDKLLSSSSLCWVCPGDLDIVQVFVKKI